MLPSVVPHELGLVNDTVKVGNGSTVIVPIVAVLEQPVAVSVYTIFAVPSETPVTTPPFVIVTTLTSLLAHVPPVAGVTFKVAPSPGGTWASSDVSVVTITNGGVVT